MYKKTKRTTISLILLTIILLSPLQTYTHAQGLDLDYFQDILNLVQDHYVEERPLEDYLEDSLKGLFNKLDTYSDYYTKEEFTKLQENLQGNFVGIGAYITEENGYIKIVQPIKGSPAEKAGLLAEDIIMSINGKSARGLTAEQATDLIKGDIGTEVSLRVRRPKYSKIIKVTRDHIDLNPVEYQIIDDIGYISLTQFSDNAYKEMLDTLEIMDKNHISKLILDLRDNPGGYLDQAIYIGNLFVAEGPLVHIQYGRKDKETYHSFLDEIDYELVVLVNENSASASEILAGAIKDTRAGTLVGVTTFGKGTVQEVLPLPRGDGIKLTIAEYYSPNMNKIDGIGVAPDITVENTDQEDLQLGKALEILAPLTIP